MCLKSDFSLGKALPSYNHTYRNSRISSNGCNALNFGSESVGQSPTAGEFRDILFENITVSQAGKAGIGIVSMDGSYIHNVTYRNIAMEGTTTPLHIYIAGRFGKLKQLPVKQVGRIWDIHFRNVSAKHCKARSKKTNYAATIDGQPADPGADVSVAHLVGPDITFTNVDLSQCSQGGHTTSDASREPPHKADTYQPRYLGVRPAYGLFVRNADNVSFTGLKLGWDSGAVDGRPSVMLENATVAIDHLTAARSSKTGSTYDVGLRAGTSGSTVTNSPGIVVKQV